MLNLRQLDVFPNMQINDAQGVILRIIRPLAPDLTEMRTYCLAPIGERPEVRAQRLRQYEDFFNPGGMATPDDTVTYAECQRGFPAQEFNWVEGYSRGMTVMQKGGNERSNELGIKPSASVLGPWNVFNEVALHAPYREWARLLASGMAGEKAFAA